MSDEPSRAPTPGPDKGETDSSATPESSGKPPSTDGPARGGPDTPSTPNGHARKPESAPVETPAQEPSAPRADGPSPADGDDRPYWKRAEDEEQDWQQRQQNLRDLDEEDAAKVGRDWIGRDANRVTGGGSVFTAGGDIWIGSSATSQGPQISYLSRDVASRLTECLVEPQSQAELAAALDREPVVFLRGADGSGRRTAALAALLTWVRTEDGVAHHADPEHVGIIRAASLQGAEPKLRNRYGYVLDTVSNHGANGFQENADSLRHLADAHRCRLIVLAPGGWAGLTGRIVDHSPPAAPAVFRRWLEREARDAEVDEHLLDELLTEIDDDLRLENSPGEAMQLACWLVAKLKAGRSPSGLRDELPRRVRDDIRRRLAEGGPILGRCFMTSAAVLNGLAETTVSAAAMRLARNINYVDSVAGEDRPPAWQHLHSWLEYADATTSPGQTAGVGPTVHLRRRVEKATLRVLWEEQPTIRQPLTSWLREIAEDGDPSVQRKAAHAAGVLATFDFEDAVTTFVNPWSKSRSPRDHRIAAMMLESAVGDPDIAPRVHDLLRRLVTGSRGERLVAAHALGSRIGLNAPGVALRELRKIVLDPNVEVGRAVAGSIGNLYTSESAGQILRELAEWVNSGSAGGLYTSALAFVRLAVIGNADPARPALSRLEFSQELGERLAVLWKNSLTLCVVTAPARKPRPAAPDSWTVLVRWVSQYNQEPIIRAVVEELFGESTGTERMRTAFRLHLRQWRRRNWIPPEVHTNLTKMMKAG